MNPQDEDLEAVIIGACLIEKTAMPLIADKIRPEMFYQVKHELIFATLLAMYRGGTDIDIITLKEEMTHLMEDTMEEACLRVANGKDSVTGIPTRKPKPENHYLHRLPAQARPKGRKLTETEPK